jgi:hypothetical protein
LVGERIRGRVFWKKSFFNFFFSRAQPHNRYDYLEYFMAIFLFVCLFVCFCLYFYMFLFVTSQPLRPFGTFMPICFFIFYKSNHPIPLRDSTSRPIAPVSSVVGGDDTTRSRRQGVNSIYFAAIWYIYSHFGILY